MTVYDEWDEEVGAALAAQIGIDMTEDHWTAIKFLREDFAEQGETPTIRRVSTSTIFASWCGRFRPTVSIRRSSLSSHAVRWVNGDASVSP